MEEKTLQNYIIERNFLLQVMQNNDPRIIYEKQQWSNKNLK